MHPRSHRGPARAGVLALPCLIGALLPAAAQHSGFGDLANPGQAATASSPFPPPTATDTTFVVDRGPLLDTPCLFASDGAIGFDVPVTRYVGPTLPDGTLADAGALVASGLLGAQATLSLPAFDVDSNAMVPPGFQPEIDRVLVNGVEVGFLTGADNVWKLNTLPVPIGIVRFPERAPLGQAPTPATNTVTIEIDVANSADTWCTSIDWAVLRIASLSPVVFVHGNDSSGAWLDRHGLAAALDAEHVASDTSIALAPGGVAPHAALLDGQLAPIAASFGVDAVHLLAHGQGGLDARAWAARYGASSGVGLQSLTSLATPHNGTVLADLLILERVAVERALTQDFAMFPTFGAVAGGLLDPDPATAARSTGFAAAFNARNLRSLPAGNYHTVGADADRDQSGAIDQPIEYQALTLDSPGLAGVPAALALRAVERTHGLVRHTPSARVIYQEEAVTAGLGTRTLPSLAIGAGAVPLANDTEVSVTSARGQGSFTSVVASSATFLGAAGRNHADIGDAATAAVILPWLAAADAAAGDLAALGVSPPADRGPVGSAAEAHGSPTADDELPGHGSTGDGFTGDALAGTAAAVGDLALAAAVVELDRLDAGTPSGFAPVEIDDLATRVWLDVATSSGPLTVTIQTPSGGTIDPGSVAGFGGSYDELQVATAAGEPTLGLFARPGHHHQYVFAPPEVGTYLVLFDAGPGLTGEVAVVTSVHTDSALRAALFATQDTAVAGEDEVVLAALLVEGAAPVLGIPIAVTVRAAGGAVVGLPALADDGLGVDQTAGDGLYTGVFAPFAPGRYEASATVFGTTTGGATWRRTLATEFTATDSTAQLVPTVTDQGIDLDANGLFDAVRISIGATVQTTAEYRTEVELRTAGGAAVVAAARATLGPSTTAIDVDVDPALLLAAGEDGPFDVARVLLERLDPVLGPVPVSSGHDLATTQAFLLSQLERPPVLLTGVTTDVPADTGTNGLFDELAVTVEADVLIPGSYSWSYKLTMPDLREVAFGAGSGTLAAGLADLTVVFDGRDVGAEGLDGPWEIRDLLVEGPGTSFLAPELGVTQAWLAAEFEPSFMLTGGLVDTPVDLDANGLFDELGIALEVDVTDAGDYRFTASLSGADGMPIDSTSGEVTLPAGLADLQMVFDGTAIGAGGVDGPFMLRNVLVTGPTAQIAQIDAGATQAWPAKDFEGFTGPTGGGGGGSSSSSCSCRAADTGDVGWTQALLVVGALLALGALARRERRA